METNQVNVYFKIKKKYGFSLVEVIVVLVLIAIVMAIAIPAFLMNRANTNLKVQAQQFKTDLELTRSIAKKENAAAKLYYDRPANSSQSYRILNSNGQMEKKVKLQGGISIDFSSFKAKLVEFQGNGSATTGGNLTVKGDNTSRTYTITIIQASGMIKMTENK